ncbi:hypothetical protein JCM16358_09490 [Halanaerocella petrolearia]
MSYKKRFSLILLIVLGSLLFIIPAMAETSPKQMLKDAPSKKDYSDAGAIFLEDKTIADYTGQINKIRRRKVIKVFNKRGVKDYGEFKIRFNKASEDIKVVEVKTIKPDGSVMKPKKDAINEITPPEAANASIYSDARIKVISMPGVEPGSIVVCEYIKTKDQYAIEGELWNYQLFQYTDPIKERKLVVKTPADKEINYKVINGDFKPKIEEQNTTKVYTWIKKDIPAVIKENNMASIINVAPMVEISTLDSWTEVSNWYQNLIDNQYDVNSKLRSKIKELTKDASSKEEKIQDLYNYVTSQIRYIGLQFGESGYRPYSATETFTNKYGVCKEKATLLIAMLREIGVKAEPVLIRRGSGKLDLDIASPALFNHLIVYLPKDNKYLDPTSSGTMYGVLPGDQGKNVLLPEENRLAKTPVREAKKSKSAVKQQVKLKQTGNAKVVYQEKNTGVFGYFYKRGYQKYTPQQRQKIIKRSVSKGFSNAQVEGVQLSGVEDLATVFNIKVSNLKVTNYAQKMGNIISFKPLRFPLNLSKLVATEERKYPLYLGFKREITRRVNIRIPKGYKIGYLPQNIKFANQIGRLRLDYSQQGREIKVQLDLKIDQHQIIPKDYQMARKLFTKADGVVQSQIMIQKE